MRTLSAAEVKRLRAFVADKKIDDLPPFDDGAADGIQYEYLHLTNKGGRRVFMNNPGLGADEDSVYAPLTEQFASLERK